MQDLEDLYIQEDQNAVFMCEVSLEDVAGEWHKDGHKIRPTSTIKIRTEGQKKRNQLVMDETHKHKLQICHPRKLLGVSYRFVSTIEAMFREVN